MKNVKSVLVQIFPIVLYVLTVTIKILSRVLVSNAVLNVRNVLKSQQNVINAIVGIIWTR